MLGVSGRSSASIAMTLCIAALNAMQATSIVPGALATAPRIAAITASQMRSGSCSAAPTTGVSSGYSIA